MTAEPFLSIRNIRKRFGGVTALDGVSLEVPAGLVFGLIGPNGSGKTTLFNVITGFLRPDAGEVAFEGRRVTGKPPHRVAGLGLCRTFQTSACPQRMTVMENMLLAAPRQTGESFAGLVFRRGKVRAEERRNIDRARELLATVNLAAKANDYAGSLSGGQRKLLSLAQALMAEPKLILLDEPVAGVNPVLAEEIAQAIRRLRAEGRNFLIVEHNMKFIRETCERVAVLDSGHVMAEGTPAEVLAREDVLRAYLARPAEQRGGLVSAALIEVDAVTAGYGAAEILHGVSLVLRYKEIVTIIGPNGAGKSTLLKVIMGYLTPTQGAVRLRGRDVTHVRPDKRVAEGIAFVPQLENVFPSLTVAENLKTGGHLLPRGELGARLDRIFAEFPVLAGFAKRRARTLSGGQRQLLAMGRALMTEPEILLLDEPSAALSPKMAGEIFAKVVEINASGRAILIVEQEAQRSLEISHRGYVLVDGRNAFEDDAKAILANDRIRAAFLGPSEPASA